MPGMSAKQYAIKQVLFESLKLLDLPPDTKAIALTKGQYTLVDADNYDFLMQWNWHANNGYKGSKFYANRASYVPLPRAALNVCNQDAQCNNNAERRP